MEDVCEMVDNNEQNLSNSKLLDLPIMAHVTQMRQTNGIKYNDFARYQKYCSQRAKTIRKKLNFHAGIKNKIFPYANPNSESVNDLRYFELPLALAERCIAHHQILKQSEVKSCRVTKHAESRLSKSRKFATKLKELCCTAKCSKRTRYEAELYFNCLSGKYYLELMQFDKAAHYLVVAKYLVHQLNQSSIQNANRDVYVSLENSLEEDINLCIFSSVDFGSREKFELETLSKFKESQETDIDSIEQIAEELNGEKSVDNISQLFSVDLDKLKSKEAMVKLNLTNFEGMSLEELEKILKKFDLIIHKSKFNGSDQNQQLYCSYLRHDFKKFLKFKLLTQCSTDMNWVSAFKAGSSLLTSIHSQIASLKEYAIKSNDCLKQLEVLEAEKNACHTTMNVLMLAYYGNASENRVAAAKFESMKQKTQSLLNEPHPENQTILAIKLLDFACTLFEQISTQLLSATNHNLESECLDSKLLGLIESEFVKSQISAPHAYKPQIFTSDTLHYPALSIGAGKSQSGERSEEMSDDAEAEAEQQENRGIISSLKSWFWG